MICKAKVSSTNLILNGRSAISPFVITANRMTPNFVPCGIPPLTVLHSDRVSPIFTACCRLVKNAAIHLMSTGETLNFSNSRSKMLCMINQIKTFRKVRKEDSGSCISTIHCLKYSL